MRRTRPDVQLASAQAAQRRQQAQRAAVRARLRAAADSSGGDELCGSSTDEDGESDDDDSDSSAGNAESPASGGELGRAMRSRMWAMSKDPAVKAAANLTHQKVRQAPQQPQPQQRQRRQHRAQQATQQMQLSASHGSNGPNGSNAHETTAVAGRRAHRSPPYDDPPSPTQVYRKGATKHGNYASNPPRATDGSMLIDCLRG